MYQYFCCRQDIATVPFFPRELCERGCTLRHICFSHVPYLGRSTRGVHQKFPYQTHVTNISIGSTSASIRAVEPKSDTLITIIVVIGEPISVQSKGCQAGSCHWVYGRKSQLHIILAANQPAYPSTFRSSSEGN